MNKIIEFLERMNPTFKKITSNKYMSALRNGLAAPMYILLFSSVFMLLAFVPNIFDYEWPEHIVAMLMRPYNFTMGFYGLFITGTIARALAININEDQPRGKKIDTLAVMITGFTAFLLMMADPVEGGISTDYLSSQGIFAGVIIGFIIPNIYKFCIDRNLTIKLPEEVPPNISKAFSSLIAYSLSMVFFVIFDIVFKQFSGGINLAQFLVELLNPLFAMADTYVGLSFVYGAAAFFQFIGFNGPSIALPPVKPAMMINLAENQAMYQAGLQPTHTLIDTAYDMSTAFGGTGATFVVVLMFAFLSKSRANKAIGKAAIVPVMFNVNEPLTFGAPLVLNPMFFIPFIIAPIANTILFKFFVDVLGMNSVFMQLPWTTPGPIGLPLGTNFHPLSFLLVILIMITDFVIYFPFFKAYDQMTVASEEEKSEEIQAKEELIEIVKTDDAINVLVICAGGGTSGLLATALNRASKNLGLNITGHASGYGSHKDLLPGTDLIILAPQAASYEERLKKDAEDVGAKLVVTEGKQYIDLTQNDEKAVKFVYDVLEIEG